MEPVAKSALLARRGGRLSRLKKPEVTLERCVVVCSSCMEQACRDANTIKRTAPIPVLITDPSDPIAPIMKKLGMEMMLDLNHHYRVMTQKREEHRLKSTTKKVYAPPRSLSIHGATAYEVEPNTEN